MAINKRKILDSAQKHLQKGALEKALKDYETLLKADPKDANCRLKIGDIQLKRGKTDEAIAAYVKVAESFMKNGFDAKAVALYKQITKIDDKRVDVFVPLAELYERMGLQSDALKVLQHAADLHYRDGKKDEALDLLRRMAALDPSNTANRTKVADLLRQGGRNDEAVSEYEAVAEELQRQGAEEDRIRILARILEIDPERIELMGFVGRSRLETGNFEAAEKTARMMIDRGGDDPEGWLILGEACDGLGREEQKVDAYRRAAEIFRERGEEDRARDLTQRFVVPAELERSKPDPEVADDLLGSSVDDLGGQNPAQSDPGFDPDAMSIGSPIGDLGEEAPGVAPADAALPPLPRSPGAQAAVSSEGDPEQLLAEASVYLRYGKHDRAIESLRTIVAQDPGHGLACMKLGDALKAGGQADEAIDAYEKATLAARASGDMAIFDVAADALAALAPERAAAVDGSAAQPAAQPAPEQDLDPELDLELDASVDIDLDDGLDDQSSDAATPPPEIELDNIEIDDDHAELEGGPSDGLDAVDLEFDDELEMPETASVAPPEPVETASIAPPMPLESADDLEVEIDVDLAGDLIPEVDAELSQPDPEFDVASAPELPSLDDEMQISEQDVVIESPSATSMTTPAQVAEDLEEADFFFQQGMLEEARAVYDRILAAAPNHPQALLGVGEIEAARPGEPEAESTAEVAPVSEGIDLIGDELFDGDADLSFTPDADDDTTGRVQVDAGPEVAAEAPVQFAPEEEDDGALDSPEALGSFDGMQEDPLGIEPEPEEALPLPSEEDLGGLEISLDVSADGPGHGEGLDLDAGLDAPGLDDDFDAEDADVDPGSVPAAAAETDVATLDPAIDEDGAVESSEVSPTPLPYEADITAPVVEFFPAGEAADDEDVDEQTDPVANSARDDTSVALSADEVEDEIEAVAAASPVVDEIPDLEAVEVPGIDEQDVSSSAEVETPELPLDSIAESFEVEPAGLADMDDVVSAVAARAPETAIESVPDLPADTEDVLSEAEARAPEAAIEPVPDLPADTADVVSAVEASAPEAAIEPVPDVSAQGADDAFDLAAQLSDVFDLEEPAPGSAAAANAGTGDEGFEQVFAAFKQGVEGALDESDFEAHYDLGIAYREMGLVEDAISEFNAAMGSPERKLACLHMMGLCALDLQRTPDAVANLEQALALPDVPSDQQMAIRFDLGRAYAADGDVVRARAAFEAVQAEDPGFQDVGEQLIALDSLPDADPAGVDDEASEAFENFDDLMSGEQDGDETPATAEPEYESFDEFMDDDESGPEAEAEEAGRPAPIDEAQPQDVERDSVDTEAADVDDGPSDEASQLQAEESGTPTEAEGEESEQSADVDREDPENAPATATGADAAAEPDAAPPKTSRRKKKISFV